MNIIKFLKSTSVYSYLRGYTEDTLQSLEKYSDLSKNLLKKENSISKSQINDSKSISELIDEDDISKELSFFSSKCRNIILNKQETVSTNLY
jgi:hypothetical protein